MWIANAAGYFALAVVLHALLVRILRVGAVAGFVMCGTAAGIALMVHVLSSASNEVAAAAILVYALACELYIFLFTFASLSISASIILTLGRAPLTNTELNRRYSSKGMVEQRLEKLAASGFLERTSGNGYRITHKGVECIATFNRFRLFFRHSDHKVASNQGMTANPERIHD